MVIGKLNFFKISSNDDEDYIRKANALIRHYYQVDPDTLDDDSWAILWNDLVWVSDQQSLREKNIFNINRF